MEPFGDIQTLPLRPEERKRGRRRGRERKKERGREKRRVKVGEREREGRGRKGERGRKKLKESPRKGGEMETVLGGCAEVEYRHVVTSIYCKTFSQTPSFLSMINMEKDFIDI